MRRSDLPQPDLADTVADQEGAPGHLEAGYQLAVDQLGLAVLQRMVVGVDGEHARTLRSDRCTVARG